MKIYTILFLVGRDRPGIVDEVAGFMFERGANIEDSHMTIMGGRFSIMTLISCNQDQLNIIRADLSHLKNLGFEVSLHEAEDPALQPRLAELPLKFELLAMDHPGIVKKVVSLLHQYQVNIHSLNTQVVSAPLSGSPLFNLQLESGVPADVSIAKVKDHLLRLAAEMNLDLNFK